MKMLSDMHTVIGLEVDVFTSVLLAFEFEDLAFSSDAFAL
jgi:hypothetical protein